MSESPSETSHGRRRRRSAIVAASSILIVVIAAGTLGAYGYSAGWFGARARQDGSFHGHIGQAVVDAGPGTWPSSAELHVDAGGPAPRVPGIDGLVTARTLYRLSASREPARPVLLRIPRPAGFEADRTVLGLSSQRGTWSPLASPVSGGTIELLVPHFSDIWLLLFGTSPQAQQARIDRLVTDASAWIQERLGLDTCHAAQSSKLLLLDYVRDSTQLTVWSEDDSTGVIVHICNRRSYYVEYRVSGVAVAHDHDLVAPHDEVQLHIPSAAVAVLAHLSVIGTFTGSALSADILVTALALFPVIGWTQTKLTLQDVQDMNLQIGGLAGACLPAILSVLRAGPQAVVQCLLTNSVALSAAVFRQDIRVLQRAWGAITDLTTDIKALLDGSWGAVLEAVLGKRVGRVTSAFEDFVVGIAEQLWDASLHNDVSHVDLTTTAAVAKSVVVTEDTAPEERTTHVRWSDLQGRQVAEAILPIEVTPTAVAGGKLLGVRGDQVVTIGQDGNVQPLPGAPPANGTSNNAVVYDPSGLMWMLAQDNPTSTFCKTNYAGLAGTSSASRTLLDRSDGELTQPRWTGAGPAVNFVQIGCGQGGPGEVRYLGWTVDLSNDEMRPLPNECAFLSAAGADWTLACGNSTDQVTHGGSEGQLLLIAPSGASRVISLGQRDALTGQFDPTGTQLAVDVVEDRLSTLHGQDLHYTMRVNVPAGTIERFGPDQMVPERWLPDGRLIGSYAPRTGELRFGTYVVALDGHAIEIGTGQRFLGVIEP